MLPSVSTWPHIFCALDLFSGFFFSSCYRKIAIHTVTPNTLILYISNATSRRQRACPRQLSGSTESAFVEPQTTSSTVTNSTKSLWREGRSRWMKYLGLGHSIFFQGQQMQLWFKTLGRLTSICQLFTPSCQPTHLCRVH